MLFLFPYYSVNFVVNYFG